RVRGLPQELAIGRADADERFRRQRYDLLNAIDRHEYGRAVRGRLAGPRPLCFAAGQVVGTEFAFTPAAEIADAFPVDNDWRRCREERRPQFAVLAPHDL